MHQQTDDRSMPPCALLPDDLELLRQLRELAREAVADGARAVAQSG
jgi:hypothetical protein